MPGGRLSTVVIANENDLQYDANISIDDGEKRRVDAQLFNPSAVTGRHLAVLGEPGGDMRRLMHSGASSGHGVLRRDAVKKVVGACATVVLPFNGVRATSRARIVSVGGAVTETLFALKAGADVIGVDATSTFPGPVRALPNVGYMRTLSAEGVLALSPTHLIATEDAGPPAVLRQLSAAGVKVHTVSAGHRYEGVLERTARLGEILAQQAQAQALVSHIKQDWRAAMARVAALRDANMHRLAGRPVSALFVMSHSLSQVMVAGDDYAADSMLSYIGAVNPVKQQFKGLKPLTSESAVVAAPDVIVVTEQGLQTAGGIDGLLRLPGLADTPAGRAKRVVAMDAPLLLGFGPRLPEAVTQLAQRCAAALSGSAAS